MYKFLFFILAIIFITSCQSRKLSKYELKWAVIHPIAAVKVKRISNGCYRIFNKIDTINVLDKYGNGGKLDAFRHTFFMAAFAQKVNSNKLKKLGIAHEKGNYVQFLKGEFENGELPDSIGTVMDLKNNDLGFEIGNKAKKLNLTELSDLVIININTGLAVIIKRNKKGSYVDCNGNIILVEKIKKWNTTKCLIKSNEE